MRAYGIHRPLGPFTWPSEHRDKVVEIVNFDQRRYVDEVGRWAFGYIDFSEDVPMEGLARYELMVPREQDDMFDKVVRMVADEIRKGTEKGADRACHIMDVARDKYGYSDEDIMDEVVELLD